MHDFDWLSVYPEKESQRISSHTHEFIPIHFPLRMLKLVPDIVIRPILFFFLSSLIPSLTPEDSHLKRIQTLRISATHTPLPLLSSSVVPLHPFCAILPHYVTFIHAQESRGLKVEKRKKREKRRRKESISMKISSFVLKPTKIHLGRRKESR